MLSLYSRHMGSHEIENLHLQPTNPWLGSLRERHFSQRGGQPLPNLSLLISGGLGLSERSAILHQISQCFCSFRGIEYLERPEGFSPSNLPTDIHEELRPFERFIGTGLRKSGDPTTYRQILPENIWKAAIENFGKLAEIEKRMFLEILGNFYNHIPKTENDLLAISTMFSMLAYGENFLRAFLREGTDECVTSLQISGLYSDVQQNFEQNYLNTCVATSMFTALSTAFVGNIKLLSYAISMEIEQIRGKLQEHTDARELSDPAFSGHSWRAAPTIGEEVKRRIGQCETTISELNKKITKVINSDANENEKKAVIEGCQKELLRAYERMCAIREVFCYDGIQAPDLLSLRPIQNFAGACALTLAGNILAKVGSFGFYVSSLSLSERFAGVSKIMNPLFEESVRSTSINTWEETFENGIMLEKRPGHMVARKAAFDRNGNRVFVIYDSIKKVPEVVPLSA